MQRGAILYHDKRLGVMRNLRRCDIEVPVAYVPVSFSVADGFRPAEPGGFGWALASVISRDPASCMWRACHHSEQESLGKYGTRSG